MAISERVQRTFDELAQAIREQCGCDDLRLYLEGTAEPLVWRGNAGEAAETVILPLVIGGSRLARLHASAVAPFGEAQRDCLRKMSRMVAASAAAIRESESQGQRLDEAEVMLQVARATASLVDPAEVAERASELIAPFVPLPRNFWIFVLGEDRHTLKHLSSRVPETVAAESRLLSFDVEKLAGPRRRAFFDGTTDFSSDAWEEDWVVDIERIRRFGIRSMTHIPIRFRGETLGLLEVSDPTAGRRLPEPLFRLLQGIADQMAVGLQNARLARENARRVEDLGALSRKLITVQEEERRRIARELHDEAGQAMTALKLNLDLARREEDILRARTRIADAAELAGDVLEELRRISHDLRPAALDDLGLGPALRALVDGFGQRSGVRATFEATAGASLPTGESAATAFRFVQEALTNITRHAKAREVVVKLAAEKGAMKIVVTDDGIGFDAEAPLPEGHLGLRGMRERARMVGGRLNIRSQRGTGVRLELEIPNEAGSVLERGR
jgi:signal transduction histidine kinase